MTLDELVAWATPLIRGWTELAVVDVGEPEFRSNVASNGWPTRFVSWRVSLSRDHAIELWGLDITPEAHLLFAESDLSTRPEPSRLEGLLRARWTCAMLALWEGVARSAGPQRVGAGR